MRSSIARIALAAALAALLAREVRRGAALARIAGAQKGLLYLSVHPEEPHRTEILHAVAAELEKARDALPGDPRPTFLLGSDALLRREPGEAVVRLRESLAIEERAETDLNLSRAHAESGDPESAAAAAVRAVWIDPPLLERLPRSAQGPVAQAVAERERDLAQGLSGAIPPLPTGDVPEKP